jgi:hypothetical protein
LATRARPDLRETDILAHRAAVRNTARAALRAAYPQARVRTLAGAGHLVLMTDPAAYDGAVRASLAAP